MELVDNKTKEAFIEYEELKIEAKKIETRLKELGPVIQPYVPDGEGEQSDGEYGYFYIQNKSLWKYTKKVTEAEEEFKELKAKEQANGDAIVTHKPILYYKANE